MDSQELANALFGASRIENTSPKTMTTLQGVAVSDSADGKVKVKLLNAESVPEENDATEENTVVELMTTPAVKEGDTVVVTAEGGVLKTMSVTGNYGSGDKQTADTEEAKKVATNYIDIDENKGITVGNMQSETLGHNTYIDANGVSIRDGETVLASFEDDEIKIGNNSSSSVISMCDEALKITSLNNMTILDSDADFVFNLLSDATKGGQLWLHSNSTQTQHWMQMSLPKIKFEIIYENGVSKLYCSASRWKKGDAEVYGETTLYSSDTGTTSTVTLSESAANFTYLEIYYTRMGTFTKSVKVHNANGKTVNLTDFYKFNDTTYQSQTEDAKISGTTITRGKRFYANFVTGSTAVSNGVTDDPLFAITRVVGIK